MFSLQFKFSFLPSTFRRNINIGLILYSDRDGKQRHKQKTIDFKSKASL